MVYDNANDRGLASVWIQDGSAPKTVATSMDGKFVYVGSSSKNEVYVIYTGSNQLFRTVPTTGIPLSIDVLPNTQDLLVLTESGQIEFFSYLDFIPGKTIKVNGTPGKIAAEANVIAHINNSP